MIISKGNQDPRGLDILRQELGFLYSFQNEQQADQEPWTTMLLFRLV